MDWGCSQGTYLLPQLGEMHAGLRALVMRLWALRWVMGPSYGQGESIQPLIEKWRENKHLRRYSVIKHLPQTGHQYLIASSTEAVSTSKVRPSLSYKLAHLSLVFSPHRNTLKILSLEVLLHSTRKKEKTGDVLGRSKIGFSPFFPSFNQPLL